MARCTPFASLIDTDLHVEDGIPAIETVAALGDHTRLVRPFQIVEIIHLIPDRPAEEPVQRLPAFFPAQVPQGHVDAGDAAALAAVMAELPDGLEDLDEFIHAGRFHQHGPEPDGRPDGQRQSRHV